MKTDEKPKEDYRPEETYIKPENWIDGEVIATDLLIVGTGFAGLWAAITAADKGLKGIAVVDKGSIAKSSNASLTLGGTVYLHPSDDKMEWMRELVESAEYLSRQDMWDDLLTTSNSRLKKLESWGVRYKPFVPLVMPRLKSDGNKHVAIQVGASWKDRTGGRAVTSALTHQMLQRKGLRYFSKTMITRLLTQDGRIVGAVGVHRVTGNVAIFKAKAIILATGQCSFRGQHAVVEIQTGDGYALAYDAGATLTNMEFLAFDIDPGAFGLEGGSLMGTFGCKLINGENRDFMRDYDPVNGTNAHVRVSTRAMAVEARSGRGPIAMDFSSRFYSSVGRHIWRRKVLPPNSWQRLNEYRLTEIGHDVRKKPEPFYAHAFGIIGAVKADVDCSTDIPGLFVAGVTLAHDPGKIKGIESARAMWSGERSALSAYDYVTNALASDLDMNYAELHRQASSRPLSIKGTRTPTEILNALQTIIFDCNVSILKDEVRLNKALLELLAIKENDLPKMYAANPHELVKYHETKNMMLCAELFLRASIERRESRESHYREDFPERNNGEWLKWIEWTKGADGSPSMSFEKVPIESYPIRPPEVSGAASESVMK
jgi:succinate dehydrogenase/fumarate reductase flavoprotein subunit